MVVTHDLRADHCQRLGLGRVHFARHDGASGLVLGEAELAEAAAGAGAEEADVLRDLEEGGGDGVEGAGGLNEGVVGGEGFEFVGRGGEVLSGHLGDFRGDGLGEALVGVDARADGGAALGEQAQVGKRGLDARDAEVELGDVAGEFLGEGEGRGVLEMGAADLDNLLGFELDDLGLQGIAEGADGGDELLLDLEDGGDVHHGREGVVGRGGHVDVVVGVDGLLRAHGAAEDLDRTVRDDFVGVHVRLGAGAGLPHYEGEVVEELEVGHLSSSLLDSFANGRVCERNY